MACAATAAWLIPLYREVPAAGGERIQIRHAVPSSGALIGRKDNCTIRLSAATISGEQCRIRRSKNLTHFELEDKSSNGTYLNDALIGKGKVSKLVHGNIIRFGRRAIPELQFRFEDAGEVAADALPTVSDAAAASTSMPPPAAAVLGATSELAAQLQKKRPAPKSPLEMPARRARSDQGPSRELQQARLRLTEESQRVRALRAQLHQAQCELAGFTARPHASAPPGSALQPPPPLRPMGSGGDLRAAEQEALLEAERGRLIKQRSVLEAELVERKTANEQLKHNLAQAEAATERARKERAQLAEDCDQTARGLVDIMGKIEGHKEFMPELEQSSSALFEELTSARVQTKELEAKLDVARAEVKSTRASEEAIQRRARKVESAIASTQQLARSLADDMRGHASVLLQSVDAASAAAGSSGSSNERHSQDPCSPSTGRPVRGLPKPGVRPPLADKSCKENVLPAKPPVQHGRGSPGSRWAPEQCGGFPKAQSHRGSVAAGAAGADEDITVLSTWSSPPRKASHPWGSGMLLATASAAQHQPRRSASAPCASAAVAGDGAVAAGALAPAAWEAMFSTPDPIEDLCSSIE